MYFDIGIMQSTHVLLSSQRHKMRQSNPCVANDSILALFDPYEQRGTPPIVQEIRPEWLDLAFADAARIDEVVAAALAVQPSEGIGKNCEVRIPTSIGGGHARARGIGVLARCIMSTRLNERCERVIVCQKWGGNKDDAIVCGPEKLSLTPLESSPFAAGQK